MATEITFHSSKNGGIQNNPWTLIDQGTDFTLFVLVDGKVDPGMAYSLKSDPRGASMYGRIVSGTWATCAVTGQPGTTAGTPDPSYVTYQPIPRAAVNEPYRVMVYITCTASGGTARQFLVLGQ